MSLKTERERTKALATKVHKCLVNINNALTGVGGSSAKDLATVSDRIWGIASNFKKTAKGGCSIPLEAGYDGENKNYIVPLNLDFEPSTFYIHINFNSEIYSIRILNNWLYETHSLRLDVNSRAVTTIKLNGTSSNVASKQARLNIEFSPRGNAAEIVEWLAIE